MKQQSNANPRTNDRSKMIIVFILFFTSIAITVSGAFFSVYSYINQISFKVINTNVSGILFGLVVVYLGARYFLSIRKLREELSAPDASFS
jgi:hypothetical protein